MFIIVTGRETIKTWHWPDGRPGLETYQLPVFGTWMSNVFCQAELFWIKYVLIWLHLRLLAFGALVILIPLTRRFYYLEFAWNVSTWKEISPAGCKKLSLAFQPNTLFVCVSWIIGNACRRARLIPSAGKCSDKHIGLLHLLERLTQWPSEQDTRPSVLKGIVRGVMRRFQQKK